MKDYTVTNIQWHIQRIGQNVSIDKLIREYSIFAQFLESHSLVLRKLTDSNGSIDVNFKLMRSDLTENGFKFCQTGYQKYLSSLDRGTDIDKASKLLYKYFEKLNRA